MARPLLVARHVEEWIAGRLHQHRNPGPPKVQRRSSGRWVMISERRTLDGGTVAVYSDISELKRREGLCWTLIHSTFENYGFFSPPRDPGGVERQVAAFEVGRDEKVSGDAP